MGGSGFFGLASVVSVGNDGGGNDDESHTDMDDFAGEGTGAVPLFKEFADEVAKEDEQGHVNGPTGKAVFFAHVGVAHAIEEELEIPHGAGEQGHEVMEGQSGGAFVGETDELAGSFIFSQENGAPNYIGDPGAAGRKRINGIIFKQVVSTSMDGSEGQGFAGDKGEIVNGA